MGDKLSRKDRQDMTVFGCVVAVATAVVFIASAVKGTWKQDSWVAIGAIGSVAQAIGVIAAVIYAASTFKAERRADTARRLVPFLDQADDLFHERIRPAASTLHNAYDSYQWHAAKLFELVQQDPVDDGTAGAYHAYLTTRINDQCARISDAYAELAPATRRLTRLLVRAGYPNTSTDLTDPLQDAAIRYKLGAVLNPTTQPNVIQPAAIEQAAARIETFLNVELGKHTPAPPVTPT